MIRRSRYLCGLGVSLGTLLVAVVAFNLLIDPYGYFGAPRIAGLNALKPQPGSELAAVKRVGLASVAPSALILGNSRAEVGFDPENPAWAARGLVAYNAALRGAGPDAAARMLETAHRTVEPRVIVLGLDFLDFLTSPDAAVRPYPTAPIETALEQSRRLLGAVATVRGLRDSIETILVQGERHPEIITERGFNPLLEYDGIARIEGYHAMFRQRAQENARSYVRKPQGIFVRGTETSSALEIVKAMVGEAKARRTELHLVIYPYHAQILLMFQAAGLWPAFEQWKQRLAEIAGEGGETVTLWDFSGISAYTTEPIPGPGDRTTEVRWYWEAGHFKKALGDVVLERLLLPEVAAGPRGFGIRLTRANVGDHLLRVNQDTAAFRAANPAFAADADELIRSAR